MKLVACVFWGVFLVFTVIDALPTGGVEQESRQDNYGESISGKVREKRKIEIAAPVFNKIPEPPLPVEQESAVVASPNKAAEVPPPAERDTAVPAPPTAALIGTPLQKQVEGPRIELPADAEGVHRVKKQACSKQQNAAVRNAVMTANQPMQASDLIVLKSEQPIEYAQRMNPKSMQRTFEPIVSFGPVSFNGMATPHSGATPYSALSSLPAISSSLHASYASPGFASPASTAYQFHPMAQLPYQHRHPMYQHTAITLRQPAYVEFGPELVYYEGKQGEETAHAANDETVSLYCQPIKSAEVVKALTQEQPAEVHERKLNTTKSEEVKEAKEANKDEQVAKVEQIKEEISQLNRAAQRIVEQQENLANMQQAHLARVASVGMPIPYPEMRTPYMAYYPSPYPTPYLYRQEDEPKPEAASTATTVPPPTDSSAQKSASPVLQSVYPTDTHYRSVMPEESARYYYPSYFRSETGFNAPNLMYNRAVAPAPAPVPYTATQEDVDFFMRMLNVGKKMGVIAKDYQPSLIKPAVNAKEDKEDDKPHKSEDALVDLATGGNQKQDKENASQGDQQDEPVKENKKARRDSRSLVMRG